MREDTVTKVLVQTKFWYGLICLVSLGSVNKQMHPDCFEIGEFCMFPSHFIEAESF